MEQDKIHCGLNKVYYAKILYYDDTTELPVYSKPIRFPGAVALSLDAEGENSNFYADNIIYYVLGANAGYSGTLEMALVTDQFRNDILGEEYDTDGNLVENSGSPLAEFALLFEFDGDKKHIRHCLYRCTASRTGMTGNTIEDSKSVDTETLNLTVSALENGLVKKKVSAQTSATAYDSWYNEVTFPTVVPSTPMITATNVLSNNGNAIYIKAEGSSNANVLTANGATGDYSEIVLSCSTPNAIIQYALRDSSSASTIDWKDYTSPLQLSTAPSYNGQSFTIMARAVTKDSDGNVTAKSTKSASQSFYIGSVDGTKSTSSSGAKASTFTEEEEE